MTPHQKNKTHTHTMGQLESARDNEIQQWCNLKHAEWRLTCLKKVGRKIIGLQQ